MPLLDPVIITVLFDFILILLNLLILYNIIYSNYDFIIYLVIILFMFNNKLPTYIFIIAAILDAILIILVFNYCL